MSGDKLAEAIRSYDESIHELIEELLTEYFLGEEGNVPIDALAVRRNRIEDQIDHLQERQEQISAEIGTLKEELEIIDGISQEIGEQYIENALEKCKTINQSKRDPSNEAIRTQAEKVGMNPQQFIELLNERYPTDRFGEPQVE